MSGLHFFFERHIHQSATEKCQKFCTSSHNIAFPCILVAQPTQVFFNVMFQGTTKYYFLDALFSLSFLRVRFCVLAQNIFCKLKIIIIGFKVYAHSNLRFLSLYSKSLSFDNRYFNSQQLLDIMFGDNCILISIMFSGYSPTLGWD